MIIDGQDTTKIIYSTSYVITDASTDDILLRFDTIEDCSYKASSTVTSYPTEMGIMANDYKYKNADTFQARGLIARRTNNDSDVDLIKSQLELYQSGMYAMNIQTKSGLRENYTLESYEIPENIDNYSILEVDMNFKEIPKFLSRQNRSPADNDTVQTGVVRTKEVE